MRNPTLSDVAKAAGVSYATADRVVNSRGNVADKSIRKVQAAMEALGYVRDIAAANLSRGRVYRLAFLLPSGPNAFFAKMRAALSNLAAHLSAERVDIQIVDIAAFSHQGLRAALADIEVPGLDGIAIVGLSGASLQQPLADLRDKGVSVVSLVSDLRADERDAYVGINNLAAGRTAARLLGMAHSGRAGAVLTLAGSLDAEDHIQRLNGFRDVIKADFPHLTILDPILAKDDEAAVFDGMVERFKANDQITAVYNVGAGNQGLVRALEAIAPDPAPLCVVHELVAHSRAALESGLIHFIIDQRPDIEAARAVTILRALIDGRSKPPMPELVPMIYVPDNLPAHTDPAHTDIHTGKAPLHD
ncbi:LacI family DNA-binding transcriptional regulator [Aliishimia ponticola]|uniref:LacI family DNA-binding transcriptional regulator n=1 Tax=Aliishimia ponticola TaxID=2499833 RepID=A0A4S4N921_9RHOB|nr:LacI family DNA-binding transcriptional regulator [Aliishimia ponticola]THH34857.1 LacI family DNA-binding transcriptional regulator [Aliishimia ponticola]